MASVINRITRELKHSIHTPDYDPGEWIVNPDLSAVANVPQSRWVIDGDTVRPPDSDESAAFDAEELAAAKSAKRTAIDAKTSSLIEFGSVIVNGVAISTAHTNQTSLLGMQSLYGMGILTFPQDVSATDGTKYTINSYNDFVRVSGLVATFVTTTKSAGRALKIQVTEASTLEQVNAIEDNR